MRVQHIEVFVEEPSAEIALRHLLPKILGSISFEIYAFQCKDELLKFLPDRLIGYKNWVPKDWRIVVLVDKDDDSCIDLKNILEKYAKNAGLISKTVSKSLDYLVVNRIVIEELEAWYFGDWQAVKKTYPRVPITIPTKARYRNPDEIKGGTWEALERVLQNSEYFKSGLRKLEVAREVAFNMQPERNISESFKTFYNTLLEIVG